MSTFTRKQVKLITRARAPKITLELTGAEVDLLLTALPYVGDREVEEEVDEERRIGEKCDELAGIIADELKRQVNERRARMGVGPL